MKGRILIVAGSDSGGGAGIQADIKTVTALGGYAMTALTAVTVQDTTGVHGIHNIPADFVAEQMRVVINDIGVDCVKIGMLHRPEIIRVVAQVLDMYDEKIPLVVDPVMVAKGGSPLISEGAINSLKKNIIPKANILTPNMPEARALSESDIDIEDGKEKFAADLLSLGSAAILVKGGHGDGDTVEDIFVSGSSAPETFSSPRIQSLNTHGTGCTLASAISIGLGQGMELRAAIVRARKFVNLAIRKAPNFGKGQGPLNHMHSINSFDE
ncbi:MAG: bifunctional hydroxymethylpyrimidine kinase/phosphomethylpyrimidine kinase [Pseudomonadota bacterium]|nr:bifunctional hydroxymethylpyrimidine kinase/phosphomethylpyrimidine kinase [Pseudomonadota bacterium]